MYKIIIGILAVILSSCVSEKHENNIEDDNSFNQIIWSGNYAYTIDFSHSITDSTRTYNFVVYEVDGDMSQKLSRQEKISDSLFKHHGEIYADTSINFDINKHASLLRRVKLITKKGDAYFNKMFMPDTSFRWNYIEKSVKFSPLGMSIKLK